MDEFEKRVWGSLLGEMGKSSTLMRVGASALGQAGLEAYDRANIATAIREAHQDVERETSSNRVSPQEERRRRHADREEREEYQQAQKEIERANARWKADQERESHAKCVLYSSHFWQMESCAEELLTRIEAEGMLSSADTLDASVLLTYSLNLIQDQKQYGFELDVPYLDYAEQAEFQRKCKAIYQVFITEHQDDPRNLYRNAFHALIAVAFSLDHGARLALKAIFAANRSEESILAIRGCQDAGDLQKAVLDGQIPTISITEVRSQIDIQVSNLSASITKAKEDGYYSETMKYLAVLGLDETGTPLNDEIRDAHQLMGRLLPLIDGSVSLLAASRFLQVLNEYPEYLKHVANKALEERVWASLYFTQMREDISDFRTGVRKHWDETDRKKSPLDELEWTRLEPVRKALRELFLSDEYRAGRILGTSDEEVFFNEVIAVEKFVNTPIELLGTLFSEAFIEDLDYPEFKELEGPWFFDLKEYPLLNPYAHMLLKSGLEKQSEKLALKAAERRLQEQQVRKMVVGLLVNSLLCFANSLIIFFGFGWRWLSLIALLLSFLCTAGFLKEYGKLKKLNEEITLWEVMWSGMNSEVKWPTKSGQQVEGKNAATK